uniref:Putative secreted protein n=1 Tax=Anopheles marajoara TaxID=58244 RepID=A0A2M4C8Z6_9DIPT
MLLFLSLVVFVLLRFRRSAALILIIIVGRFLDDRLQHATRVAITVARVRFRCLGVRRQPRERNVIRDIENVLLHRNALQLSSSSSVGFSFPSELLAAG